MTEHTMQVTPELIRVLTNFASININLKIDAGNVIKTRTVAKSMLATATLNDSFPQDFCIYDLTSFLGVINMFEEPELIFGNDEYVTITDKDRKASIKYLFADPNVIVYPEKDISMPQCEIEFALTKNELKSITKAAAMLKLDDICVRGRKGKEIQIIVTDAAANSNHKSNEFVINVGEKADEDFDMWFNIKNWNFIHDDYVVQISSKRISKFTAENANVEYFLALEKNSTYGE